MAMREADLHPHRTAAFLEQRRAAERELRGERPETAEEKDRIWRSVVYDAHANG